MSILCLISSPSDKALTPDMLKTIQKQTGGEINWLHQKIACEIISPCVDADILAQEILADQPIDICLIAKENRRKKLLIADMDSTMINEECIDELADALGLKEKVADITAKAMNGELDFAQALDTRVALLEGLNKQTIEEVRRERITLAPGGRALVQTMSAYGAHTALISGGFTIFANYIAKRIGFDEAVANELLFNGDKLTGKVAKPIVDSTTKLERLQNLTKEKQISLSDTLAVGDGANDLAMIKGAGLGVALHAKPNVAAQAKVKINHADLTALLYLQGYGEDEIVR